MQHRCHEIKQDVKYNKGVIKYNDINQIQRCKMQCICYEIKKKIKCNADAMKYKDVNCRCKRYTDVKCNTGSIK